MAKLSHVHKNNSVADLGPLSRHSAVIIYWAFFFSANSLIKAILISEDYYTQHLSLAKAAMHYYHVVYLPVPRDPGLHQSIVSLTIIQIFECFLVSNPQDSFLSELLKGVEPSRSNRLSLTFWTALYSVQH